MTDLPKKRPLREALEQVSKEVRSWPEWKQQLARNNDFRIEPESKNEGQTDRVAILATNDRE